MNWYKRANTEAWFRAYDSMDAGQLQSAISQLEQQASLTSGQSQLLQLNKRLEYARNALSKQTGQPVQSPAVQAPAVNQSSSGISVGDEITFMMGNPPYFQPEKAKVVELEGDGSVWVVDHSNRKLRVYPNQIQ